MLNKLSHMSSFLVGTCNLSPSKPLLNLTVRPSAHAIRTVHHSLSCQLSFVPSSCETTLPKLLGHNVLTRAQNKATGPTENKAEVLLLLVLYNRVLRLLLKQNLQMHAFV